MNNKPHLLIVDDDSRIVKLLKQYLSKEGFLVSTSTSAKEALTMLENFQYDLMILDVMMPEITGLEFATQLKSGGSLMPIVMLTALSEPEDRVKGLESGANDYVTKPFEPRELVIRINNLLESNAKFIKQEEVVFFGSNSYNKTTKELLQHDKVIPLSTTEENLLEILIKNSGKPIAREELAEKMGGVNVRSIDVQIVRLRSKIELNSKAPKFLKTARNHGYALYI